MWVSAELQHEYKSTSAFYLWRSEDSLKLIQAEWEAVLEIFDVFFYFFKSQKLHSEANRSTKNGV